MLLKDDGGVEKGYTRRPVFEELSLLSLNRQTSLDNSTR